jgi:hypothetical protein
MSSDPESPPPGHSVTPPAPPPRHPTLTAHGLWWGVDSSDPITADTLANVHYWYGGAQPQMWGRYLDGSYAVTRAELAFARQHGIYVYVIVPDENCSVCDGGADICGNDHSSAQARADAATALRAAHALRIPAGTVLFKDIEQIGSCTTEPTATFLTSWYDAVRHSGYRVGFYGNSYRQFYNFPRAYCAAAARDPAFVRNVTLDDNEPEPQLGADRNTIGPHNAPPFAPFTPHCAPDAATAIWQYGESVVGGNDTDVDQARPGAHGLIAPNGGVS